MSRQSKGHPKHDIVIISSFQSSSGGEHMALSMEAHDVCAFPKNDPKSDGDHPNLSGESKQVIQPALRPFTFLELAVELRIGIYRYALTCSEPIASESNKLLVHEQDNPAVALLRTCKTIFSEGGQVFYGENDFRFQHEDFFFIPKLLPEHNFRWLKQLTMTVRSSPKNVPLLLRTSKNSATCPCS
ncbi:hypothetical protein BKA63DRAFT_570568 [Paraphoma chrysanthemicola]|nr:hypothetical protein BKA63DRAFT_570568 [Paraphoma chrysanthemicola]